MLFAHNNLLKSLPSTISSLEHLRFLDLHNNQLEELPHNFGESLKRLTELILFKNSLTSLPTSIVGMKHIVKMELQYNALKELPESIGELATLQVLNLSHNVLQSMPSTLGTLRSLSQLDISHNQLVSLPMSMANLKRLQSLWVDSNQLSTVPEVILSLDNLNLLSLRSNFIGPSLPVALSKLCKLTYIWLNDNQIELLPAEIACMQNLQDLYLSSNPCFKAIPAPPTAPINPNPIPVPSSRVYLPSLCAFASRTILEEAAKNAPPDLLPRSSLVPFIKTDYDLSYDILSHVDTIEDACTKCMLPCWGSGKDHIYDEEWYPGQFIRIGWRHCYFCCSRSEQNNPQY
jgi:Leucine-rich repeat (LRR) protein